MTGLLAELRRRNVIRVAALYLVTAWLLVQVAGTLLPVIEAPAWVMKALVGLLALGFVPVLAFSWVFELTPEGLKRESEIDRSQSITQQTARRLDIAVIVLLLGIGALMFWRPAREPASQPSSTETAQAGAEPAPGPPDSAAKAAVAPASIAVLPFADLSPSGDQAYFSDGMSEEILNALVKVDGLQVASRTSSFGFRGQEAMGVPAIAQKLAVRHVLEGSVRRAGSTLRITAQLIDAQTDRHLWSETYDRPLTAENVFAIQEEISIAIVAALVESMGVPGLGSVTVAQPTADLDAYDLYLRARALFLARRDFGEVDRLLQQAVEQDPGFAKAWELRAAANSLVKEYEDSDLDRDEVDRRSIAYAERALSLEPASSLALATLANVRFTGARMLRQTPDIVRIVADLERALEIDPHNINAMNWLALAHGHVGETERALDLFRKCMATDPQFAPCTENEYETLWTLGRADEAHAHFLDALARGRITDEYVNFPLLAHFEERALFMFALNQTMWLPGWRRADEVYEAYRHLDQDHAALRDDLLQFLGDRERSTYMASLLLPLGAHDEIAGQSLLLWGAEFARYRKSPQFKRYAEVSGALAYWQAKGFPAPCRAAPPTGFECD
jgi:TolB-like protein/Tfp pilus assembly protein PilF